MPENISALGFGNARATIRHGDQQPIVQQVDAYVYFLPKRAVFTGVREQVDEYLSQPNRVGDERRQAQRLGQHKYLLAAIQQGLDDMHGFGKQLVEYDRAAANHKMPGVDTGTFQQVVDEIL